MVAFLASSAKRKSISSTNRLLLQLITKWPEKEWYRKPTSTYWSPKFVPTNSIWTGNTIHSCPYNLKRYCDTCPFSLTTLKSLNIIKQNFAPQRNAYMCYNLHLYDAISLVIVGFSYWSLPSNIKWRYTVNEGIIKHSNSMPISRESYFIFFVDNHDNAMPMSHWVCLPTAMMERFLTASLRLESWGSKACCMEGWKLISSPGKMQKFSTMVEW